mmetsp:Transcript_1535/g.4954  ORF Transcript_1535/g.4954 Transcript_1535/m.4954 type:complete len:367 (+) Transcript_1535:684-1784(+)
MSVSAPASAQVHWGKRAARLCAIDHGTGRGGHPRPQEAQRCGTQVAAPSLTLALRTEEVLEGNAYDRCVNARVPCGRNASLHERQWWPVSGSATARSVRLLRRLGSRRRRARAVSLGGLRLLLPTGTPEGVCQQKEQAWRLAPMMYKAQSTSTHQGTRHRLEPRTRRPCRGLRRLPVRALCRVQLLPMPPPPLLVLVARTTAPPAASSCTAAHQVEERIGLKARLWPWCPRVWERGRVHQTRRALLRPWRRPWRVLGGGGRRACREGFVQRLLHRRVHPAKRVEAVGVGLNVGERTVRRAHLLSHQLRISCGLERLSEHLGVGERVRHLGVGLEHATHLRIVEQGAVQRGEHLGRIKHRGEKRVVE